jgi:hypothetical protein
MEWRRGNLPRLLFIPAVVRFSPGRLFFLPFPRYLGGGVPFMPSDPAPNRKSILKNPLLYSSAVVVLISLSVVSILVSRWESNRAFERRQQEQVEERQREADRAAVEQMGGNELAIQMFYASPPVIHRGQTTQLCYGVANAKSVAIEPNAGRVWPSYSRCLDVTPQKTTTYTLTITGASGTSKTQSVTVKVL